MLQTVSWGAIWLRKLISSGCSVWNRTSKLILHRLLWCCRALICCQCDEAPGPVPLSSTQALIHRTFFHFVPLSFPDNYSNGSDLEQLTWTVRLKCQNSFWHILNITIAATSTLFFVLPKAKADVTFAGSNQ